MLTFTDWLLSSPIAIVALLQCLPNQLVSSVTPIQSCWSRSVASHLDTAIAWVIQSGAPDSYVYISMYYYAEVCRLVEVFVRCDLTIARACIHACMSVKFQLLSQSQFNFLKYRVLWSLALSLFWFREMDYDSYMYTYVCRLVVNGANTLFC